MCTQKNETDRHTYKRTDISVYRVESKIKKNISHIRKLICNRMHILTRMTTSISVKLNKAYDKTNGN